MAILRTLASELDFKYSITNPEDLSFGAVVNGKWNGQVEQVSCD